MTMELVMTIEALLLATGNLALVVGAAIVAGWLLYNRLRQVPPSTYAEMEQTLADMNRQMSELRQQQAADHTEMRRLRGEIGRIDAALQEWTERFMALSREFREATGREPNTRPPSLSVVAAAPLTVVTSPAALLKLMCETFDMDEIDGLVFEMGLGRNVRGDSTEDRARSLISAAQRRGRLPELIELCRRERPNGGF
jgi:septal ring factor EnvC (AmiA/AmiB activator)